MLKRCRVLAGFWATLCLQSLSGAADAVPVINIDDIQTTSFDGWGTSLAWWANAFGDSADAVALADLCFTTDTVSLLGSEFPGLGMNIVRYNIGASRTDTQAGADGQTSESILPYKRIPAFQLPPTDRDKAGTWDWTADAAQRDILQKAVRRGADKIEFFADSPPWWMCKNGSAAGGTDGLDNLKPGFESVYTDYLAGVVEHARKTWRIRVDYLEPFNEPTAWWWKYPVRQEACHFSISSQRRVLEKLTSSLHARDSADVGITASDENDMDGARETWKQLGAANRERISKINVHGYIGLAPYRGSGRTLLRREVGNRKMWMSEYCDKDASGLTLAQSILLDINELQTDGWCYWQAIDGGAWGLIQADYREYRIAQVLRKYYVFAHFSRHLPAGSQILRSGRPDLAAAFRPADRTLVLVHLSTDTAKPTTLQLTGARFARTANAWSTKLSPAMSAQSAPKRPYREFTLEAAGDQITIPAAINTITTLEITVD